MWPVALYLSLLLVLLLALNRGMFDRIGLGRSVQLLLIWGVIFAGGALLLKLLGFG